jgi:hypothetical protein
LPHAYPFALNRPPLVCLQLRTLQVQLLTSLRRWRASLATGSSFSIPQPSGQHPINKNNNDNRFTWSGPSGVFGFTGQRRLAPAVGGPHEAKPFRCAIEPAESSAIRKPPRRKKITTQVWGGWLSATHLPICPEQPSDRKPPAPLAFFLGTGTNSLETLWSPSFPLVLFTFARVVIWVLAWDCSPAPSNREGAGSPRVFAF